MPYNFYDPNSQRPGVLAKFNDPGLYALAELLNMASSSENAEIRKLAAGVPELLGVLQGYVNGKAADQARLDKAIRPLILQLHPDRFARSNLKPFFDTFTKDAAFDSIFKMLLVEKGTALQREGKTVAPGELAREYVFNALTYLNNPPDLEASAEEKKRLEEINKQVQGSFFDSRTAGIKQSAANRRPEAVKQMQARIKEILPVLYLITGNPQPEQKAAPASAAAPAKAKTAHKAAAAAPKQPAPKSPAEPAVTEDYSAKHKQRAAEFKPQVGSFILGMQTVLEALRGDWDQATTSRLQTDANVQAMRKTFKEFVTAARRDKIEISYKGYEAIKAALDALEANSIPRAGDLARKIGLQNKDAVDLFDQIADFFMMEKYQDRNQIIKYFAPLLNQAKVGDTVPIGSAAAKEAAKQGNNPARANVAPPVPPRSSSNKTAAQKTSPKSTGKDFLPQASAAAAKELEWVQKAEEMRIRRESVERYPSDKKKPTGGGKKG